MEGNEELSEAMSAAGHGSDEFNCAEFCPTSHHFIINGHEMVVEFKEAGTQGGCTKHVSLPEIVTQQYVKSVPLTRKPERRLPCKLPDLCKPCFAGICEVDHRSDLTLQVLEGVEPNEHGTWQVRQALNGHVNRQPCRMAFFDHALGSSHRMACQHLSPSDPMQQPLQYLAKGQSTLFYTQCIIHASSHLLLAEDVIEG